MYQSIIAQQKNIYLEEDTHTYIVQDCDIQFTSVTEFINNFFEPFNEIKIATKLSKMHKYQHLSVAEILKDWEKRRDRGTIVHKEIEDYLKNKNEGLELDLKSIQGIDFLKNKCINNNNLLFPEVKIYSKKLKIAGTIDLMIYNKQTNRIYLIDWKTNAQIKTKGYKKGIVFPANQIDDCSFNRYNLQLSIYQYIIENFYNAQVDGLYIIHLKDSSHDILNCKFQTQHVLDMLTNK